MSWLKDNWKRLLKYVGLGAACLVVALLAFVGARWMSSGSTYEGDLVNLAPEDVSVVMRIDNVPARLDALRQWLAHLAARPGRENFEATSFYQNSVGKILGASIRDFHQEAFEQGLIDAGKQAERAGLTLFEDVLGGELVLCSDPGPDATEFISLSRLSRRARFRWSFLDVASRFFPPELTYRGGVLEIVTEGGDGRFYVAVVDDVLIAGNSRRLLDSCVGLYTVRGGGVTMLPSFQRAHELVPPEHAARNVATLWLNLDRMRDRLPAETERGKQVSPVDSFTSLPPDLVGVYPDILGPVNRILEYNLDTRPYQAALYTLDVTVPDAPAFHQYLLLHPGRANDPSYQYLRRTFGVPQASPTQLVALPADTMFHVSYRQPVDLMFEEVFDQRTRESLVGDFLVAVRSRAVRANLTEPIQELAFAMVPKRYAPDATLPIGNVDFPLPGFALMFRAPEASHETAHALLDEYLQAQRGRGDGQERVEGAVSVVPRQIAGQLIYALHDPRPDENFLIRLNRSIRAGMVGEWLMLTNSERLIEEALRGRPGLAEERRDIWRRLPGTGSASLYINMDVFADYASSPEIARVLRESRFNTGLINGRDLGDVRREIAAQVGVSDLTHPEVTRLFNERRAEWLRIAEYEGSRFQAEFPRNMEGLRYLGALGLVTQFAEDHVHVHGVLGSAR